MGFNRDGQSICEFGRISLLDTGAWDTCDDYIPLHLTRVDYACEVSNTACRSGGHVACIPEYYGYILGHDSLYIGVVCGGPESELDESSSWYWVDHICVDDCSAIWRCVGTEEVEEDKSETAAY
jgi:hypothetical protein